ncbi:MAG: ribosome recycling factor [Caldilineaceae bacterium]|nr:ribosome recycling factor [Caldilineaceae bacterium]
MIKDVLNDADDRMHKTIEALRHDLMSIRTGRASPALVEHLKVEYYGVPTPLMQLATISVPDAQTLAIRPYAANDIPTIERAIALSDLGLTPNNDGQVIRLTIPALTEDRRRELTKMVNKRAEEARVAIRNIRRDNISDLRDLEKESIVSEDDSRRAQEQVQDKTNAFIKQIDDIAREKDEEIMTI